LPFLLRRGRGLVRASRAQLAMQRAFVVLAVLALPAASSSTSALITARHWLRRFAGAPPTGDQLGELKTANPEAYAIVKALLTKRSLGLLDPKHPTASFSNAGPPQQAPAEEQGPEAFAKFSSPGELRASHTREAAPVPQVALPYASVQPAAHHDWMNWKPQSSAMDDDTMVQNVLGAVAELKGKKAGLLSKRRNVDENPLAAEEATFAAPAEPKPAASAPAAPKKESGYLDFSIMTSDAAPQPPAASQPPAAPQPQAAALVKENSYLKGLDLTTEAEASSAPRKNYLSSFSWDDSTPAVQERPKPAVVATPKVNSKENSLLNWLGVVKKGPAPEAAPAAPAKPANPYILDLSF